MSLQTDSGLTFFIVIGASIAVLFLLAQVSAWCMQSHRAKKCVWRSFLVSLLVLIAAQCAGISGYLQAHPAQDRNAKKITAKVIPTSDRDRTTAAKVAARSEFPPRAEELTARWLGAIWIAGSVLLFLRLIGIRVWLMWQKLRMPCAGTELAEIMEPLAGNFQRPAPQLRIWHKLQTPAAFGCFRGILAVPRDFADRFTPNQARAILLHELAHFEERDPEWNLLSEALCALLWWHPALWLARKKLMEAGEIVADDASSHVEGGAGALAEALLRLGQEMTQHSPAYSFVLSGSGFRSDLGKRVLLLVNPRKSGRLQRRTAWMIALWGIFAAVAISAASPGIISPSFGMHIIAGANLPSEAVANASQREPTDPPTTNPAVSMIVQVAEIKESADDVGLDWLYGPAAAEKDSVLAFSPGDLLPGNAPIKGKDVHVEHFITKGQTAALAPEQFSALTQRLKQRTGMELLTAPRITNISGRNAEVSVEDTQSIVTESRDAGPLVENLHFGQFVNITPFREGEQWRLDARAHLVEFLGYQKLTEDQGTEKPRALAQIRVRTAEATAFVPLGSTLAIRGPRVVETSAIKSGIFGGSKTHEVKKRLYIFITIGQPKTKSSKRQNPI